MPNSSSVFSGLNESTVQGWFKSDGRTLRPRPQAAIEALKKGGPTANILHPGRNSFFDGHHEEEAKFIEWML